MNVLERTSLTKLVLALSMACAALSARPVVAQGLTHVNLVSDIAGVARRTDPDLVNPWGIALAPNGRVWVADNHTGVATVYEPDGKIVSLVVTIPPPGGSPAGTIAAPTGLGLNQTKDFAITGNATSAPSIFLFCTEDGTVAGWNPATGPANAILAVDNSGAGAIYKGLTTGQSQGSNFLYVANFSAGVVEIYDGHFGFVRSFTDATLPMGYAPFNVRVIKNNLYVTFALQDADKEDDVAGPGHGFVDVFDLQGNFVKRFASQGPLDSPWGLEVAPITWGKLAGALLVGNFGDGRISAYNLTTGAFIDQLKYPEGDPIEIEGLWSLLVSPAVPTPGSFITPRSVYFTAGFDDENHGLFGFIRPGFFFDFR